MPRTPVDLPFSKIDFLSILDENGKVDKKLEPRISKEDLLKLYRAMLLTREFDDRMLALQRQGRIGTFAQTRGQEAAQLGSIYCIEATDWFVPSFRETGAAIWRGCPMENILLVIGGFNEGGAIPQGAHDLPVSIPVGTHMLHAAGIGMAIKYKKKKEVVITYFGDGATSEGDFHEALNFASLFQVPVIFVCQNNQYAISVPVSGQTRSKTLAQKAIAYDMPGIRVDGNDILAMIAATKEAVTRARKGEGPTLIEATTYRLGPHTTADDPTRYRKEEEIKLWQKRDPLLRFHSYLKDKGWMDDATRDKWAEEVKEEGKEAVKRFEEKAKAFTDPLQMFDFVYADLPPSLQEQREELAEHLRHKGEYENG